MAREYLVAHRGTRGQWVITRANLVEFLERRAAPAVRVGFDLTLTTEKSLGVLALLGDEHTRRAVLGAIQAGNDEGLGYLEFHAAGARSKGKPVLVRGLTIASFRHLTSRALDPFPHHHNVIANSVIDEHGTRRALDARGLYTHAQAASAIATVQMRYELTRALGIRWRRGRSGSWEIDGIADEVLREFSQRRNEIEDAVAELEAEIGRQSTLAEVQNVITGTRPAKEDVDPSALVEGWWERARRHGLTPETLARCTNVVPPSVAVDEARLFEELTSPTDGICAGHSIFTRSDVLVALADIDHASDGPIIVDARNVERLADAFLASDHVVQLDTSGLKGSLARQELFTTREILTVQQRIIDRYTRATGAAAAVPAALIDQALANNSELTGEQRHLVQALCGSGLGVQCAIGRAGAGKTTTMRVAAEAWRAAGYHVIGAAVKGEAARQLAAGADIPTETVAWYLARADQPPLHDRTVFIIDEASTLSDRDLDALLDMAEHTGATIRLIGDPDQHGAVAAGGMFRHLCATHPEHTPELSTTHRVADPADQAAARLLRSGRTHDALAALDRAGHLHIADNDIDLYLGMLGNWWDAHQAGSPHPMVDRRHHTRRVLNRLARQLRRASGELGDNELHASGDRDFATGDRVVARMAARHLHVAGDPNAYVRNGATGTITAVTTDPDPARESVEVCFDEIGPITLPRGFVDEHDGPGRRRDVGIDHAYAVTSYAVQGATFDQSTSRIDEGATRSETYVDITRGRTANHLFITRAPDPLDGEHLPKAPDAHLRHTVADRLHRSGPERAAIELPVLHDTAVLGRLLAHDPPAAWTHRLAPTPADPVHLRRRERAALEATLAYRHRWQPDPGLGGYWTWALGSSASGSAASQRAAVAELLDRYADAVAAEHLPPDFDTDWLLEQLTAGLSTGMARSDLRHLVSLAQHLCGANVSSHQPGDPAPIGELLRALPYGEWLARSQPDALGHHDPSPLHLQGPA
jgi:conjugative relaxase-like TrwC/TraI family protein